MLTDSFDPRTPAKINPAPSPDALSVVSRSPGAPA